MSKDESLDLFFGNWINEIDNIRNSFIDAQPFEYVVIDNFLNTEVAENISMEFPTDFTNWHKYNNPLEVKYAFDNLKEMGENTQKLFSWFASDQLTTKISHITDITNLEYDPHLHGAGLHVHPRNGRLNLHLDYEKHPLLNNKERRLNIILFLSKDWKDEWHGDNQLWNDELTECMVKTNVRFNRALLFKTNNISWHGLPNKITCPEGIFRKSIAYYYISDLISESTETKHGNSGSGHRTKACYRQSPNDLYDSKIQRLINIRPFRRIEKEDMDEIWSEWNAEEF